MAKRPLRDRILTAVGRRFGERTRDLQRIAHTGYSFEEWFNWEVIFACGNVKRVSVMPRPSYQHCGISDCKLLGDIFVEEGPEKLILEIGTVHDWTGNKW